MSTSGSGRYSVTLTGIPMRMRRWLPGAGHRGRRGDVPVKPCVAALAAPVGGETPLLFINEFMADNEMTVADDVKWILQRLDRNIQWR